MSAFDNQTIIDLKENGAVPKMLLDLKLRITMTCNFVVLAEGKHHMKVKLILLIAVTLLMTHALSAQTVTRETPIWQDDVPNPVLQAFKSAYPKTQPRSYMKLEVNGVPLFYRIEIAQKALHRNVTYNPDGSVAKLEDRIAANELPAAAQQIIKEKHPQGSVERAEKVTRGDQIEYKAAVKSGGKSFDFVFDADGKLISTHEVKVTIVLDWRPDILR